MHLSGRLFGKRAQYCKTMSRLYDEIFCACKSNKTQNKSWQSYAWGHLVYLLLSANKTVTHYHYMSNVAMNLLWRKVVIRKIKIAFGLLFYVIFEVFAWKWSSQFYYELQTINVALSMKNIYIGKVIQYKARVMFSRRCVFMFLLQIHANLRSFNVLKKCDMYECDVWKVIPIECTEMFKVRDSLSKI